MYIYRGTYLHIYMHIYICIYTYTYIHIYMYVHIHICMYIYTYVHVSIHMCTFLSCVCLIRTCMRESAYPRSMRDSLSHMHAPIYIHPPMFNTHARTHIARGLTGARQGCNDSWAIDANPHTYWDEVRQVCHSQKVVIIQNKQDRHEE